MNPEIMLKLGEFLTVMIVSASLGFYVEHLRFENYQDRIEIAVKNQQVTTSNIETSQKYVSTAIATDYLDKLNDLNDYYDRVQPSGDGSCKMPRSGATASSPHGKSPDPLAAQCAKTTLMLIELQKWVNDETSATYK
jgi:hypothetical protein